MRLPLSNWLPLGCVVVAAFALRTCELARRPMHADEANQAVKLGELLDGGRYEFDPADHHGPSLYYAAVPVAWMRGERSLATLSETTVRLVPALAGTMAVVLLAVLAAPLGRGRAVVAAGLLAISPPAVYYSRYFIQETLLVASLLGALVCAQRWWKSGRMAWALAMGAGAGLMQATKASAPLFAGAAMLAAMFSGAAKPASRRWLRDIVAALAAGAVVAALFYSSFGFHPAGLRDAWATYGSIWQRVSPGETGHEKPWWYYLRLFGWQREGGLVWQELAFGLLALGGILPGIRSRIPLLRWTALYTLIVAAAFSLTPYKTPWHAVHFVPGMALLAAWTLGTLWTQPAMRIGAIAATATVVITLGIETRRVAFLRAADPRNPFAYVHSSPDVLSYRDLAEKALARDPKGSVRVIAEEYWPLPWYLRGLPRVGYWSTPPPNCDGALVIASSTQADTVRRRLRRTYSETFLGLRRGVICIVFTPVP